MRWQGWLLGYALGAQLWLGGLALAEDPSQAVRDQAAATALQGIELLDKGNAEEALGKLREAEQLFHAPTHVLYMARANVKLGRLVEAHRLYVDVAAEPVPNYAPEAFHKAQATARSELYELRGQVGGVELAVRGVPAAKATVLVDGQPLPAPKLEHLVALEPGEHTVAASAPGMTPVSKTFQIEAAARPLQLELVLEPVPAPAAPPVPAPAPAVPPAAPDDGALLVAGGVLAAVGAASLVVGAITGGLTLSQAGDITPQCDAERCPLSLQSDVEDARLLGNVSTGTLIAGGAVAAAGLILLLVAGTGDDTEPAAGALPLSVGVGPGGLELRF